MIEITNKQKSPLSLVVRSLKDSTAFTTLIIPGVGNGKNVKTIPDERYTEYLDRAEQEGLVKIKRV